MKDVFDFLRAALPRIAAGLLLAVLAGIAVFLPGSHHEGFTGSRVKNPDAYLLDIEKMNGIDLHTLELHEGDVLQIQFESKKGSLYMEIKAPDGTIIYRGNGKEITEFTVNIRESGIYTIVVEARHAKGTIHIQLEEDTYTSIRHTPFIFRTNYRSVYIRAGESFQGRKNIP